MECPCARRTRTMKQCSSDARTMGLSLPTHKAQGHRLKRELRREQACSVDARNWGQFELARTIRKDSRYIFSNFVAMVPNDLALAIGITVCSEPT